MELMLLSPFWRVEFCDNPHNLENLCNPAVDKKMNKVSTLTSGLDSLQSKGFYLSSVP
jgi:hypothetical protein